MAVAQRRRRRAALRVGTVSAGAVATVIDAGVAAGIRREILLAAADAREEDFRDPDARLPVAAVVALWQALARQVSDPGFGVMAGAAWRAVVSEVVAWLAAWSEQQLDLDMEE